MEVLICGAKISSRLCKMLRLYKPEHVWDSRERIEPFIKGYDVVVNIGVHPRNIFYLSTCEGVKVNRFQGSDWYRSTIGKRQLKLFLRLFPSKIMYASQQLKEEVRLPGEFIPVPVNTHHFYPRPMPRDKDICYYCPDGKEDIYQLHLAPKNATILNGLTPYDEMPGVYSRYKKYVRNTVHDANPKMPYEALLCGCEVWWNGQQVVEVPDYMLAENTIPRWVKYFEEIVK